MKKVLLFMMLLSLPVMSMAGNKNKAKAADAATAVWEYEIEPAVIGKQGSCVVKVWSFSKSPSIAVAQAYKNAVHGVIFKGVPAKDRIPARKPLVSAMEMSKHQPFFDGFFRDGGPYMAYATRSNSNAGKDDIMMVSKKEYKVGCVVTVNYDALKRALESEGIIKGLSSGF